MAKRGHYSGTIPLLFFSRTVLVLWYFAINQSAGREALQAKVYIESATTEELIVNHNPASKKIELMLA